jgi:hypothetical protein
MGDYGAQWDWGIKMGKMDCDVGEVLLSSLRLSPQAAVMGATVTGDRGRNHASFGETNRHALELSCMIYDLLSILYALSNFLQYL